MSYILLEVTSVSIPALMLVLLGCLAGGLVMGLTAGWVLRPRGWRWYGSQCRSCLLPVGTVCIECRDRQRARDLTGLADTPRGLGRTADRRLAA